MSCITHHCNALQPFEVTQLELPHNLDKAKQQVFKFWNAFPASLSSPKLSLCKVHLLLCFEGPGLKQLFFNEQGKQFCFGASSEAVL